MSERGHAMLLLQKSVCISPVALLVPQGREVQPRSLLWSPAWMPPAWREPHDVCGRSRGELLTATSRSSLSPETWWGEDLLPWIRSCHASDLCTGEWFFFLFNGKPINCFSRIFFPLMSDFSTCFLACFSQKLNVFKNVIGLLQNHQVFLIVSSFTTYFYSKINPLMKEYIKVVFPHNTILFSHEGNEVLIPAKMWMKLKNIKLNEKAKTITSCMMPFIWNFQNWWIHLKNKSQRHSHGCQGLIGGENWGLTC